jgi:hypothetical protein
MRINDRQYAVVTFVRPKKVDFILKSLRSSLTQFLLIRIATGL